MLQTRQIASIYLELFKVECIDPRGWIRMRYTDGLVQEATKAVLSRREVFYHLYRSLGFFTLKTIAR